MIDSEDEWMTLGNGKRVMKRGVYVQRFLSRAREGNQCEDTSTTRNEKNTTVRCILDKEHVDGLIPHYVGVKELADEGMSQMFWGDTEHFYYLFRAQGKDYNEVIERHKQQIEAEKVKDNT